MCAPATRAQIKLINDLIDAGAAHELNFAEKPMTSQEADVFIRTNKVLYDKLRADRRLYKKCQEICSRSTPDEYNIPNM